MLHSSVLETRQVLVKTTRRLAEPILDATGKGGAGEQRERAQRGVGRGEQGPSL